MAVKKKYDRNVLGRGLDDIGNGRGLDALIDTHSEVKTEGSSNLNEVEIAQIEPNPNQPRREFDPEALQASLLPFARWMDRNTRLLPVSAVGVPRNWPD